jgi:uncharacterized protein YcbX
MSTAHDVGAVGNLWRYPVKSMLGERLEEALLTTYGVLGDRAWALRDLKTGRIASAKKYPALLSFRAHYDVQPTLDEPGRVAIEMPGGQIAQPDDPETSERISQIIGLPVRLENKAGEFEKTGIVRETVFGDVPVGNFKPEWTPETMPDYFQLKSGSFFEIGSIFVLTSGSVEHLRALQGGTAQIDQRRFRPNIYIESKRNSDGFVEDEWIGGTLEIGASARIHDFSGTVWCVTATLPQEELPRDLSILRTIARDHNGCLGVYAIVRSEGKVRVGDPIVLLHEAHAESAPQLMAG